MVGDSRINTCREGNSAVNRKGRTEANRLVGVEAVVLHFRLIFLNECRVSNSHNGY